MKPKRRLFTAAALIAPLLAPHVAMASGEAAGQDAAQLRGILRNLLHDNALFAKSHPASYYKPFAGDQHPRATVVTCSDSRVHDHALDETPDGDLFMVRNIGNQLSTAEGSVEYGVHHLHTPLLLIVGHVACGAIKAAQGDYSSEPAAIRHELSTLQLTARPPQRSDDDGWLRNIDANVNNQVGYALKKFEAEVRQGKLTVVGAIYDFRNDLRRGRGRLVITNVNGNTNVDSMLSHLMSPAGARVGLEKKPAGKRVIAH